MSVFGDILRKIFPGDHPAVTQQTSTAGASAQGGGSATPASPEGTATATATAAMNIWLQKQVMKKLADNGGKVPAELKG